ncbi:acyl-CoA dehydrogenase family protein [Agrococcus citreus]|uniref:Acyl-CoA dehydrogenase n=1 Tax=Agrococcus citreus TaxID=84643 RepID=A0ABP4JLP6_9MICO
MTENDSTQDVRAEVRELVAEWRRAGRLTAVCDSWLRSYDPDFSREMGRRGLIGITWPSEAGGAGKPGIARLVVTEELLRVGAPVAGHWIADRQIGPAILRHGSDVAKQKYLPGIASGEMVFCLGMSETESGSDLASVRTTATRVDGGWTITGRKIWTSQAHHATHAYVLARTERSEAKHEGLSEFIVDMRAPGVEVRPIYDLGGEHHFNEVTFDGVAVDDDHVIGTIGNGWAQVTSQLSLERGGIERVLSTYPLLAAALEAMRAGEVDESAAARAGEMLARLGALRAMAVRVALDIDAGGSPVTDAAVLKDLGTAFENEVIEFARDCVDVEPDPGAEGIAGLLASAITAAPGFTIRGGTSEVLKTLIARGAGDVIAEARRSRGDLGSVADEVLEGAAGEAAEQDELRAMLAELGWYRIAVPEEAGGEGGGIEDAVEILESLGRASVAAPVAESVAALRALARGGRTGLETIGTATVATGAGARATASQEGIELEGRIARVPWGAAAESVLVRASDPDGADVWVLVRADAAGVAWEPGRSIAGEPRDALTLSGVRLPAEAVVDDSGSALLELSLFRAAQALGALETALASTIEHVTTRHQFGRPLVKFQAVAALLAEMASEYALARVAVEQAVAAAGEGGADAATRIAAARVVIDRASTSGSRIAHQLHAAMGITREHALHLSTRRLWSWRDEEGTGRAWAARLGRELVGLDEAAAWAWITEEERR